MVPIRSTLAVPDFRLLFESAPGLYLVLLPDLTIVAASDAYLAATMTERSRIIGKPLFEVFPDNPEDVSATGARNLRESLERVMAGLRPDSMAVQKYDIRKPEAEGGGFEERHWSPINSPVLGESGGLLYIIHRVEDVSEFVRLQRAGSDRDQQAEDLRTQAGKMESEIFLRAQDVQEANRRLRALNEELDAFAYSVSHDLRAPLRAMIGFSDMLREKAGPGLDEDGLRYLEYIHTGGEKMNRLIDNLLAFSKLGRQAVRPHPVDMDRITREACAEAAREQGDRSVEVKHLPLPVVQGDPALLRQVMINLLSNAFKYTRPRPKTEIEVGGGKSGGECVYYVKDNGVGFDMRYYAKLFGVFQRLHSEKEFEGNGIGLAGVNRIVQKHGGRVWAESAVGAGATFFFALPDKEGAPADAGGTAPVPS